MTGRLTDWLRVRGRQERLQLQRRGKGAVQPAPPAGDRPTTTTTEWPCAARHGGSGFFLFFLARAARTSDGRSATLSRRVPRECSAVRLPGAGRWAVSVAGAWNLEEGWGWGWATTMTDHRHRHRAMLVVYYPSSACRRPWFEGIRSLDCHGLRMLQGAAEAVLWMIGGWIGTGLPPRAVTWTVSRTHGTVAVPELQVGRTGTRAHAASPSVVRRSFSSNLRN
jgi:hypothetical protein